MNRYFVMLALACTLLLAACAVDPAEQRREAGHVADVQAAAGKPVGSFTYFGDLYSWEPLTDHSLLVYTRPRQAWLLEVGPCPRLQSAPFIGITSHVGQVSTGFDSVLVHDGDFPCRIQQIRPVDMDKLHERKEQRRKVEAVPRVDEQPSSASSS